MCFILISIHLSTDPGYLDPMSRVESTTTASSSIQSHSHHNSSSSGCSCGTNSYVLPSSSASYHHSNNNNHHHHQGGGGTGTRDPYTELEDLVHMSGPLTEEAVLKVLHHRWQRGECQVGYFFLLSNITAQS